MRIHNDKELRELMISLGWGTFGNKCPWDSTIKFSRYSSSMTRVFSKTLSTGRYNQNIMAHYGSIPNLQKLEWIWNPQTGLLTCENFIAIRLK